MDFHLLFISSGFLLLLHVSGAYSSNTTNAVISGITTSLSDGTIMTSTASVEENATTDVFTTKPITTTSSTSESTTREPTTASVITTVINNTLRTIAATESETTGATQPTTVPEETTYMGDGSGEESTTVISTTPTTVATPTTIVVTTSQVTTKLITTKPVDTTTSTSITTPPKTTGLPTTTPAPTSTTSASSAKTTPPMPPPAGDYDNTILAICLAFFIFVLILFAIVLYLYCTGKILPCMKGRRGSSDIILDDVDRNRRASNSSKQKFAVGHMHIEEEDFENVFNRKVADDGRGFREEFRAIQTIAGTTAAAKDNLNAKKNRYDNVLPWDDTRVLLSADGEGSDYINGNFVPGYLQEKKFIACQGPTEATTPEFWKMVWEQNCNTIVMTTNVVENNRPKCFKYWPGEDTEEGVSVKYGNFTVTLLDSKVRNFYVSRTLQLKEFDGQPRVVRHLHYTAWPDFGVPSNPSEMLLFRRRVIAANPPHSGPIVVHCSAGVGRTGTYILIDSAMEQLKAEGKVDVFSFLSKMRKHRMMLVQTDAQYTFAHAAILHHIKYGETEVPVKNFKAQFQSLRTPLEDCEETVLEEQFSTLLKVPQKKENMKHGRQSIKKNRVLQIIPYDENRVTLPVKPGQEKSDYINASFIDGFKDRKSYIATQGPLEETAEDFWTMIWVYRVPNIVMLTATVEKGQQVCARYWPEKLDTEETFGDITVKYVAKDEDDVVDYIVREFSLTRGDEERRVRQFHYLGWPEVGLPSDAHGMIEIANRIADAKHGSGPTVVHCSSGGGRTGVFICLIILVEQIEDESMIDVFQAAKSLRAQRPHIIQTQEQFYFCYDAVMQYLETEQKSPSIDKKSYIKGGGDNATLTSNLNSSIGNPSQSASQSNGTIPNLASGGDDGNTPSGSVNNRLDCGSSSNNEEESDDDEEALSLKDLETGATPPPPGDTPENKDEEKGGEEKKEQKQEEVQVSVEDALPPAPPPPEA